MNLSWLEAAGNLVLACYLFIMGALFVMIALRAVLGHSLLRPAVMLHRPTAFGARAGRILLEYVGNTSAGDDDVPPAPTHEDRRRNRQARALLDRIKDQMKQRGFADRDEQFLEELRETVRREERTASRERTAEAFEDSPLL